MKSIRLRGAAALALALSPLCAVPAASSDPVKVSSPQAVKGVQQVVIGAFNVGFLFQSVDGSRGRQAGGLGAVMGGATRADSELVGVTPAMMQAITDAAYDDFRAQLAAQSFTVADAAPMYASEAFARVKPVASPYEASVVLEKNSKGKTSFYKPTALPGLVMLPGDFTSTGFSGMGMTMASGQTAYGMSQHAKASGQAVIDVVYLIDFSNVRRPGAFSFAGIKVTSGMAVVGDYSKLNLIAPTGKQATIVLKEPVAVEGDFATMEDATSRGSKAGETAMNVASGAAAVFGLGGMGVGKTRKFTFTAKPEYQAGATKAATLANARLVSQLVAPR